MRITICGSNRFKESVAIWNSLLTAAGHVVYSIAIPAGNGFDASEHLKLRLDAVHAAKIANSDAIFVVTMDAFIDTEPYVGTSTFREMQIATSLGKAIHTDSVPFDLFKKDDPLVHEVASALGVLHLI